MRKSLLSGIAVLFAPLAISGCATVPPKPAITPPPAAVQSLRLHLRGVNHFSESGLADPLRAALVEALAEAGLRPAMDPAAADGTLDAKIDQVNTTFSSYHTTLNLISEGRKIESVDFTGGSIGNNVNRNSGTFQSIAEGIAYNLVARLLVSPKVAAFALEPRKALPAGGAVSGAVSKAELEQIVKSAVAATKASEAPAAPAEIKSDVDAPAYKAASNPDAFAVVVGVEKYNALPDARFAERDAKAMNAHLLAMGYPQRNIVLLTGSQATKTGLVKNLEAWLPNQITERSMVLFYFSGHGAPDAKTSAAYLVPMDGDPQYLEETAYPIKRLYEKLAALKAKRVLVALDSCFSGAGGRSVIASGTRPLVAKLKLAPTEANVVSLSASSAEEITGALEDQGHGLFTYHLLKALSETAGRGSVSELHAALTPRVQDEARRQNRAQTPQLFGASIDGGLR